MLIRGQGQRPIQLASDDEQATQQLFASGIRGDAVEVEPSLQFGFNIEMDGNYRHVPDNAIRLDLSTNRA